MADYPRALDWLIERLSQLVGAATDTLEGEFSPARVDDWQAELERQLMRYYTAAYLAGAGETELDDRGRRAIMDGMRGQIGFLNEFAVEMKQAAAWKNSWNARAKMYAKSIVSPYWRGKTKILPLPAMPAEGTQCKTNCKCKWDIVVVNEKAGDYDAYWRLGDADHCQTCIQRAQDWNPLRIRAGHVGPGPAPEERTWLDFGDDVAKAIEWSNRHFRAWRDNLPSDLRDAVRAYTGAGFHTLNRWLRSGMTRTFGEPVELLRELRDGLDAALARSPGLPENVILYRGTDIAELEGVRRLEDAQKLIGVVKLDEGYGSTSLIRGSAFSGNALMRVRAPEGTPGAYVSFPDTGVPREYEYLIARGYTFRVLDVQWGEVEGRWLVDCEIILSEGEKAISQEKAAKPSLRELLERSPSMRGLLDAPLPDEPQPEKFFVPWAELKDVEPPDEAEE